MIAGFEHPTAGRITINGEDVTNRAPNKRHVGMVFQSYALFPNMTVAGNIGFGLKLRKRPKDQIDKRVEELLGLIHLEGRGDRYPYQLSGGQQQRVALARALAIEPQVLLLDEPLSALDAKIRVALRHEIREIQRSLGITTVYVTHDQEEALELSDRIVVMSEGRIEQIGTPFEIYNFPATAFVASFVGTLNAVEATHRRCRGRSPHDLRPAGPDDLAVHGPAGEPVMVALRPEMITLVAGSAVNGCRGPPLTASTACRPPSPTSRSSDPSCASTRRSATASASTSTPSTTRTWPSRRAGRRSCCRSRRRAAWSWAATPVAHEVDRLAAAEAIL